MEMTSRLISQTNMKPRTPTSMETMVTMTHKEANGFGMRKNAMTNMMMVPAPRHHNVDEKTPRN